MNPFSPYNLPITIVIALVIWAWFSLLTTLLGALF
jgi:hypothetical protein